MSKVTMPIAIALILTLLLTACSTTNSNQTLTAVAQAPGAFKVAILLPGRINDNAWNQAGYQGLKLIEKQLEAQVTYRASVPPADWEKLSRQYAQQGVDFLIVHSEDYLAAAEVVAKEFRRVKFAVTGSYAGNNNNFGALAFRSGEIGYLAGVVAALKTKTNKVAYIGGQPYPITREEATLLERGAKKTKPSVVASINWVNSWSNAEKARKIALAQIAAGADVLVTDAGEANRGVLKAAQESRGVYAIGWMHSSDEVDQTQQLAPFLLTSVVQQVPSLLLEGATLVQQGRWEGKQYKFGLLEGVQDLAPFKGSLSPQEEALVKSVKQDIIIGKIDVSP
ncbi:MAG TPA: BMP family ABC transporter substrate-binding protein [Cyanobacteria bacterium UBA8543]|nr:BMP family ABC transporter substrate-binding protein [Cyanobacteria bacterium UBA8543]